MMEATAPDGFADTFAALRDSDRSGELARIRSRVTVVTGAHDHAFPHEAALEMAMRIERAQVVVVPDAAHLVPAEQPAAFAQILRKMASGVME